MRKVSPIVTDNKKTGFNVRLANKKECIELYTTLNKKVDNRNGFMTSFKINRDAIGFFFTVESREDANLKDIIIDRKKISSVDFDDIRVIASHVDQLKDLHDDLNLNFSFYYGKLFRSKKFRRSQGNDFLIKMVGDVIRREYVSNYISRRFGQRKINIKKAISFKDIIIENSEIRRLGCPYYAQKLDRKDIAYKFADAIGLRRPFSDLKIYKLHEIKEQEGPVVVKLIRSTGSMGVYLVFNKNLILSAREGTYLNSWEELKEDVRKKKEQDKYKEKKYFRRDEWMIEELIEGLEGPDSSPNDIKFYTFYGEVMLVSESNPAYRKMFCYWDAEMNPVKTGRYDDRVFAGRGFTEEDLNVAVSTSLKIPAPFVRLDMLKGKQGLIFGEATYYPGHYELFNDKYDRILGEAYRKAQARLLRDLLNGKKFDAFNRIVGV